ncbi:hypothetical protein TTHERM_00237550 (macronuclear) [Tetrahymena thermophila SB210]|uniref:Uncharacterized protein n=1 Tax=Tetrahymena thermophila (strain SB210) TaxID=312017 RepID=I7MIK9_TETTS|nr:hypothetical protein TTHERM_00237550 [Tetrahymena thermophila SB210]EAS04540.2 hypothetical protein TTHERM_00237550 [Tetrahymena thermophila SB210]|eukprot:XP_001024785.2 hypothetical protein TTHERM_00237550 [Tetrahymena thermophila SB210]
MIEDRQQHSFSQLTQQSPSLTLLEAQEQNNQHQQKIYEEFSGDSLSTTHNKQNSSINIHPLQSIEFITEDMGLDANCTDTPSQLHFLQQKAINTLSLCKKAQQTKQIAVQANYIYIPTQYQLKILNSPSTQYTYNLGGEMVIDLRWVMNNMDDETLNGIDTSFHKMCPNTYTLQNKSLMLQLEQRQQPLFQFKFLPQMLYSLGTAKALQMAKLVEQYQQYVDYKRQQLQSKQEEINEIDKTTRRESSYQNAKAILSKQNPNEFFCSYIGFGDEEDFYTQKAQCFSPLLLEILGVSSEEMAKIALRKGSISFFDWKTQFNISMGRLMMVSKENSQRGYQKQEVEIMTFDGFRIKSTIQFEYYPLNQNLLPYSNQGSSEVKYLLIDYLVIMKFSFHPLALRQLMLYRQSDASKTYKQSQLEEEFQESVFSSMFLEKYYEKELENLGQKKKKIRKTKAKAQEEMSYFSKLQKNKFQISQN